MTVPMLFDKKENCCGCGACAGICPKKAITMEYDEYGFKYPVINEDLCIHCKKCKSVCAFQSENDFHSPISVYAAVSTSTNIMDSASGGVFASIANEFIQNGENTAVGSALENIDGKITVHHISVNSTQSINKLLGSKYVHSDTLHIFNEVKNILEGKKKMLFSGTPCQVASLYSFLGKEYENLYTIELICHGVPGEKMFGDYIDLISEKYGKVTDFVFRDKKHGPAFVSRVVCDKNGKKNTKYIHNGESAYYAYFLQGNIYRECCYKCKYASQKRIADIAIGDYWGVKKQHPELFDGNHSEFDADKGISCLLVNTQKGEELIGTYAPGLSLYKSTFDKVSAENAQLKNPSVPKGNRAEIMEAYKSGGYEAVDNIFKKQAGLSVVTAKIKANTPLWIKKLIKRN